MGLTFTDRLLTNEFLDNYKGINPFENELGLFTYIRTYSRYLPEEQRREYWWETVARAVEYNVGLGGGTQKEAELLFENVFYMRQFLAGRTLWAGGGEVSKNYPMSNYNCAFTVVDSMESFWEVFYLLLVGSGVGFRVLPEDVSKLPRWRQDVRTTHYEYVGVERLFRKEYTQISTFMDELTIDVGDSKEGWTQALETYLHVLTDKRYKKISKVNFRYNNVRPKGERIKTFGGFASGHEALQIMFVKLEKLVQRNNHCGVMTSMEITEAMNIIGEGVVSGGVRRIAQIAHMDANDDESIRMKNEIYTINDGQWEVNKELLHRQMSNNSIYYKSKPTRDKLKWHIEQMRFSGEPGLVNSEAGSKRRTNFNGTNPCGEILLDSKGVCNLTEVNVMSFVTDNMDFDYEGLKQAMILSTRAGIRMTLPVFELHRWDLINKRDRLIGVSLTGWQDMVNATQMPKGLQSTLLRQLKDFVTSEAKSYSKELAINEPLLKTTIKPSGTASLLPGVSPGIHYSHSEYYVRRVRISYTDPLAKAMIDLGYQWNPEVGQSESDMSTVVIDFPVHAPKGKLKGDVTAIEQLENYKMFMEDYVEHNVSITVHVRDHEWDEVEQWVWDNWDGIVAVSFIPYDDSFYSLTPYEELTESEYEALLRNTPKFDYLALSKFEDGSENDVGSDCDTGACPVR